ncbi:hypothetical protein PMAYCL1PPCAC_19027, partial [Pristionchus mayeri]
MAVKSGSSTKKARTRLIVAQRSMMRKMAGVTRMDRKSNEWLANKVPIQDVRVRAMHKKWTWARRIASLDDDRWTQRIVFWTPWDKERPIGRPRTRWRDEIVERVGINWADICRRYPDKWTDGMIQQAHALFRGVNGRELAEPLFIFFYCCFFLGCQGNRGKHTEESTQANAQILSWIAHFRSQITNGRGCIRQTEILLQTRRLERGSEGSRREDEEKVAHS